MWQPLRTGLFVLSVSGSMLAIAEPDSDSSTVADAKNTQLPPLLTPRTFGDSGRAGTGASAPPKGSWKFVDGRHQPPKRAAKKPTKPNTARIIGGNPVPVGARSYQASVQGFNGHFCGAAVIDDTWVLTAAHCMAPSAVDDGFTLRVGVRDLATIEGVSIPAVDVIVHPDFNDYSMDNDIALVRLAEPAPAAVARLPIVSEDFWTAHVTTGAAVTASGWGSMGDDVVQSTVLQQVSLPLTDRQACIDAYAPSYGSGAITERMICAGYDTGGIDTCQGDSGGPLTFEKDGIDYSLGITSWGNGCAIAGFFGVYTNVAAFYDWIDTVKRQDAILPTPLPAEQSLSQISGATDQLQLFSFTLDSTVSDLLVELNGDNGDADLYLYDGAFALPTLIQCTSSQVQSAESCRLSLAHAGKYLIGVYGYTDFDSADLSVTYESNQIDNNTMIEEIKLRKAESLEVVLDVPQDASNLRINLTGGIGDADLYVTGIPAKGGTPYDCQSYELANEEECALQNVPAGTYYITITSFANVEDLAMSVSYDEPRDPRSAKAACEYQVLMQFHHYQFARLTIKNLSDQPLEDWYMSWSPVAGTVVKSIHNGQLSSTDPVRIEGKRHNRTLEPGASAAIQLVMHNAEGTPESPTVSGNYCE